MLILKNSNYPVLQMDRLMYSQFTTTHGRGIRNFDISCSDMAGSIRMNQDQISVTPSTDYLLECTYVADGTDVEFTIDPVVSKFSPLCLQQPCSQFEL